jgi:hypothetical protein
VSVRASASVSDLLAQRESELLNLLRPGQLPPRASVITALRRDIASLRQQAYDEPAPMQPSVGSALISKPAAPAAATGELRVAPLAASSFSPAEPPQSRVFNALKLVEQQMAVAKAASTVVASVDVSEMEFAIADNTSLRARLDALVVRQRQLQGLLDKHLGKIEGAPAQAPDAEPAKPKPKPRRRATKKTAEDGAEAKPKRTRKSKAAPAEDAASVPVAVLNSVAA